MKKKEMVEVLSVILICATLLGCDRDNSTEIESLRKEVNILKSEVPEVKKVLRAQSDSEKKSMVLHDDGFRQKMRDPEFRKKMRDPEFRKKVMKERRNYRRKMWEMHKKETSK